jgi:hypothetical protein
MVEEEDFLHEAIQDIIFKFHYNRKIVHYQILENIIGLGPMEGWAIY